MSTKRAIMRAFYRCVYIAGLPYRDGGITILSYHSLDNFGTPLSVAPRLFERQMATLARQGCTTLTMSQVGDYLHARKPFPPRAVAITFDDGFASVEAEALPVLAHYGLSATVYLITGMIGKRTRWTDRGQPLPSLPLMNWQQIEQLHQDGVEIGAHSITHGFLTQYSPERLNDELFEPKVELERRLGVKVEAFAYPQGDYDDRVVRATRLAGYKTAVTVDQGRVRPSADPLRLHRLLVSNNTTRSIMRAFTVPSIGPTYTLINLIFRQITANRNWPRRKPGEVDSTGVIEPDASEGAHPDAAE